MSSTSWPTRVLVAVDHVHSHLDDDLSPERLAALAGFSLHHFHRVFRGLTGESVMGFVRRLRLERAAGRLTHSDTPITDIALTSGYGSHEAFTRAFRSRFGTSPRTYRSQHVSPEVPAPEVRMVEQPDRSVLALRHVGPYDDTGSTWQRLFEICSSLRLDAIVESMLGLCYDDPEVTRSDRLRFDACAVIRGNPALALPPEVAMRTVPGGRYAVATHLGPYDTLGHTYVGLLGRALPFLGLELTADPVVEHYVNNPTVTAPEELVTEVCVRIA
ncbi:MAG: AraC family transcriptional regulator [Myxococcales bacterium]|nr:AraC family transcriptional regulator [Myxococcales bacterium]